MKQKKLLQMLLQPCYSLLQFSNLDMSGKQVLDQNTAEKLVIKEYELSKIVDRTISKADPAFIKSCLI